MEYLLKLLAHHWGMSPTHYWHLRLLVSLLLGPILGVLYLVFFDKRARYTPRAVAGTEPSMWVSPDGRLIFRP